MQAGVEAKSIPLLSMSNSNRFLIYIAKCLVAFIGNAICVVETREKSRILAIKQVTNNEEKYYRGR